jgi:predicted nucleotidyltransferase
MPATMDPLITKALEAMLSSAPIQQRRVIACWAFGSRAAGKGRDGSDVDLAVLCEPPLGLERTKVMDIVGRAVGADIDLIDMATAPAGLRWEVVTTGRLVVEHDELAVEEFVRRARWDAEDEEQRNRMILLAQLPEASAP